MLILSGKLRRVGTVGLWAILSLVGLLVYKNSLLSDLDAWLHDEEYSFALIVPLLGAYLIWVRRNEIRTAGKRPWNAAYFLACAGCGLQVLASRSGSLPLSGIALILNALGVTGFVWGKGVLQIVAGPIASLILMSPLPSYITGELSWHLQSIGSTASGEILRSLGVPVLQQGNILRLANYALEVKQACSGFRSIFALLVLACGVALSTRSKLYVKVVLVAAAPFFAIIANVIRIVGTGLIANRWGHLAANNLLHEAWGIAAFVLTVLGLLGTRGLILRFQPCRIA